ncbi:hypothetical protein ACLB2K_045798 [Fragaria x ananassa]
MELDWAVRIRTGPTGPILLTALNENAKFKLSAGQVQDGKLSASAVALDGLSQQMNDLSIKLESAEETIRTREKELEECRLEKEETD